MKKPPGYSPTLWQYESHVLSGKIVAGRLLKLAVERHRRDLEFGHQRGLKFDPEAGKHILDFSEIVNIAPETPIRLYDFQTWELYVFYGWKRENGLRRFREKYKSCSRGSGKTPLESLQILYHLSLNGPYSAEAYVSATKELQAKIAFDDAKLMVECSPELQEVLDSTAETLFCRDRNAKFQFLTSNPKTADGTRPSFAVIDEYHEFDSDAMYNKLSTGLIKKEEPILSVVTTRGSHKDWPCAEAERKVYVPILEGSVENDSIFVVIYAQDSEDEFEKPETWQKSNPMLCEGGIIKLETLIEEKKKQVQRGEEGIVSFKTLNLNMWTDRAEVFIPDAVYVTSGAAKPAGQAAAEYREAFEEALAGKPCWAGLDMSQTNDFTALALYFPPDDWAEHEGEARHEKREGQSEPMYLRTPLRVPGRGHLIWRFWIPRFKYEQRIANGLHSLRDWEKAGYVRFLEGNVIDPLAIEEEIKTLIHPAFPIRQLLYDRYNATSTAIALDRFGIPCLEMPQTMPFMAEPTKAFRDLILQQRLDHGGNPVARWMMRNAVPIADTNQNIKITKDPRRAADKVDGIVAAIMALASWMKEEAPAASPYETSGIFYL